MATKKKQPSVEPWKLKEWASEAAQLHVSDGVPLSMAVIRVLTGKKVGVAHIKRVCEEANTQAFNILFSKGRGNRSVVFEGGPADPAIVIRELKDGFAAAPAQEAAMKTASLDMEQVAGTRPTLKGLEQMNLLQQLRTAATTWKSAALKAETDFESSMRMLEHHIRTSVTRGVGVSKLASALASALPDDQTAMFVMNDVLDRVPMMKEAKLEKVAGIVNTDHPVVKYATAAYQAANDWLRFTRAYQAAEQALNQVLGG